MSQVKFKQRFSRLKVCSLLVLGMLAVLGAGCSKQQVTTQDNGQAVAAVPETAPVFKVAKSEKSKGRRFKMNLTLEQPSDLKVNQGDKVIAGQVIVERQPTPQQRLTRIQLVSQINAVGNPKEEYYLIQANQQVELAEAQLKSYIDSSPYTSAAPIPTKRLVKQQSLEAKLVSAANRRNTIAARLEIARQEMNFKKEQLELQLRALDADLEKLKTKSPYTGTVRRVKVERGSNSQIAVTLTIQTTEAL